MNARTRRRLLNTLSLTTLVSSLLALALVNGYLRPLQLQSSDLLFRLKPDSTARWAVLVAIDDRSLAELRSSGRLFNWPRQLHAQVIDNIKAAGARFIVWDVLFDAPAEGDAELARSIRQAGNVILAEAWDPTTRLAPTAEQRYRYADTLQQLPALREAAVAIGYANQLPDPDGAIRAVPLVASVREQELAALPLIAAGKFLRRPRVPEAPIQDGRMAFAGREIPVDQDGRMWISYLGDSSRATNPPTFPTISYVDALNNTFPPELVRGKLVFVGIMATAFADDYWTPVSRTAKMDGVEIHANAFETIMRPEEFVVPATNPLTIGLIYLAGLIAFLALTLLSPLPAAILGGLAALAYLGLAVYAVDGLSLILDLSFPMLSLILGFLAVLMYRVVFEQAQQRALKGAMSQYLSPDVMEEVVRDPSAIKLGGEKREMTVLFSDLRGFTSLSETLDPEQLVHLLNVYLTRMSDVIFKHQGTVDKYMGDAIMAFWGAPRAQPDHARRACLTALEMVDELASLNAEFHQQGIPPLNMGIGLNSGPMAVGNMGSERRFDYTVMGDAVNLGSRLEALNKEYGTSVIAADSTLAQAGKDIRARFIDLVAVKGKKEPAAVYELLPANGKPDPEPEPSLAAYARGLERYRARDYAAALRHFEEAHRLDPHDPVTALYIDRSRALLATPPPADWDGVYVMTHK